MKECIILAGGLGTRLQSVVKDVPKSMADFSGKPFLFYLFQYLKRNAVNHVILSLGYKSDVILNWLKQNEFPFKISYVIESVPLGTGGAIKLALTKAENNSVFIMNGDTYFDVNLAELLLFHEENSSDLTLSLRPMENFDRYGSVETDKDNRIVKFNEKQFCNSGLINGGVYLVNKGIFSKSSFPEKFSFEKNILENTELKLNMFGYIENSYFIDIGIPNDYEKAKIDFKNFIDD